MDEPDRPRPPVRPATVRLGSHGREPVVLIAVLLIFLVGAMWKPWAGPARSRPLVQARTPQPTVAVSASADPLAGIRAECEEPNGWRVYSREGFLDQTVRVWRSVEPAAAATGPLDPGIP